MRSISLTVNGTRHELEVEPRELLVYVLREQLGLTGTNVGCDTSSCGACTVLLNGESVKSCTVLAVQADGQELTTIEGLAASGELHPVQQAFHEQHGLQCGYCTPGDGDGDGEPARGERPPDRGGDPRRARGQPLPLHRVPQHRQGRPGRGGSVGGRDGRHRDTHVHRLAGPAPGGQEAPDRAGLLRRQPDSSGHALDGARAQPVRPRADRERGRRSAPPARRASSPRTPATTSPRSGAGRSRAPGP